MNLNDKVAEPVRVARELICRFLRREVSAFEFCADFETLHNFHIDKSALDALERETFLELFRNVVRFSDHPIDLVAPTPLIAEEEIRDHVSRVCAALGMNCGLDRDQ
jgi:hypothetical protein